MAYPDAERQDIVEDLHGHLVADPYRWLEDRDSVATKEWSAAQHDLWLEVGNRLQLRDHFADRIRQLTPGAVSPPDVAGDRAFFLRRQTGQQHAVLFVRDADGSERPLVDPNTLAEDFTTTLDAFEPSPDGRLLAYQLSAGGTEESVLRVMDVDTEEILEDPIPRCRYSPIAWRPDNSGFHYMRYLEDGEAPGGTDGHLHRRVWFHLLGQPWEDDEMVFGDGSPSGTYFFLDASLDGRWLVVGAAVGTAPRNDLWVVDLDAGFEPVPVQVGLDAQTYGGVAADGQLWLRTDLDASRGRVVACDPAHPGPEQWRTVVAEDPDGVLESWALTDAHVVVQHTVHVVARVTSYDRATLDKVGILDLPGQGDAGVTGRRGGVGDRVWISYLDFTTPLRVLEADPGTGELTTWAEPPGAPELPAVAARQAFFASADGTRIPMFVIAREDVHPDGRRPTILYGYGGFNQAMGPGYSAAITAWVEAGGVFAIANLRGGSEYGEEWHRAGMRHTKQNVFDDFYAAAGHLIAAGWTDVEHLGISGGSNGGLLTGVAATQRPDLFRSVVCSAPLLDMVRYERFGLGSTWNDEYGRADDPTELGWLLGYSPYHHVEQGTEYPAVLFTVFGNDTRVDPLHARKMCAALQWATASDPATHPVVIRAEVDAGHGARSVDRMVGQAADQYAFHAWALGLDPAAAG